MNTDKRKRRIFWQTAGVLCFLVSAVMVGMAGRTWLSYRSSEKGLEDMYREVQRIVPEAGSSDKEGSAFLGTEAGAGTETDAGTETGGGTEGAKGPGMEAEAEPGGIQADIAALQTLNADAVGWIRIPGTVIDYPVMHTPEDPNYYFHRDFYGKYSAYGMIYLDGSCRLDGTSPNLLVYGHHMRNGSMFASIEKYASSSYWEEHPEVLLTLADDAAEYEVMAAMRLSADTVDAEFMKLLAAGRKEDYERLMQYVDEHSLYDTGITASWPESLITLTTCEYSQKNGRFLLIARRRQD